MNRRERPYRYIDAPITKHECAQNGREYAIGLQKPTTESVIAAGGVLAVASARRYGGMRTASGAELTGADVIREYQFRGPGIRETELRAAGLHYAEDARTLNSATRHLLAEVPPARPPGRSTVAGLVEVGDDIFKGGEVRHMLSQFAVDPRYQKEGIGTHLLHKGIQWMQDRFGGDARMGLEVVDQNEPAKEFYRKLGFSPPVDEERTLGFGVTDDEDRIPLALPLVTMSAPIGEVAENLARRVEQLDNPPDQPYNFRG